jgi:hypothetical protein
MMNYKHIAVTGAIITIALAGGFYGGMKFNQNKIGRSVFSQERSQQVGQDQSQRGNARGGMMDGQRGGQQPDSGNGPRGRMGQGGSGQGQDGLTGDVIAKDEKSITIKTVDGGSKIIFYADTTTIDKSVPSNISDVNVGQKVRVRGSINTDGSVAAQNIHMSLNK